MFRWTVWKGRAACAAEASALDQRSELLLDLAFLEFDMLAQHRIVFLDCELLGHGAGVLLGDIEEAARAVEADLCGGRLRHGTLQEGRSRGAGNGGKAPVLSSNSGKNGGNQRFLPRNRSLPGPFPGLPPWGFLPRWGTPPALSAPPPSASANLRPPVRGAASSSFTASTLPMP